MRTYTWEELREVSADFQAGEDRLGRSLQCSAPRYQMALALAFAVAKWSPERGWARGTGLCGLCALRKLRGKQCVEVCPLAQAGHCCLVEGSLWKQWRSAPSGSAEENAAADALYNVLVRLYAAAYARI